MAKKTTEELQQEVNDIQFLNISKQIKGLRHEIKAEINAKDSLITLQLDKILNQTLLTNGRVSKLEKETSIWRFLQKYPKIAGLLLLGVYTAITYGGFLLLLKL